MEQCPDTSLAVCIHENRVKIGTDVYLNVAIDDVLDALARKVRKRSSPEAPEYGELELTGSADDPTCSANLIPACSGDQVRRHPGDRDRHLHDHPTACDCRPGSAPRAGHGGSIGWATPPPGVAMAKTSGNTWLVTGDGHIS